MILSPLILRSSILNNTSSERTRFFLRRSSSCANNFREMCVGSLDYFFLIIERATLAAIQCQVETS